MRIYLAGGITITNVKGRERELFTKYKYKRLFSFFYMQYIKNSNILTILEEHYEDIPSSNGSR